MHSRYSSLSSRTARILVIIWFSIAASTAWPQASWVGDVEIAGEPSNLWRACQPCLDPEDPPNTNWSNDRIPGDDGPLGDPGTGAVIGPDFVVDHNGGTLDLSTLNVQGSLLVNGLINISESATINNINLESGGRLDGPGPITLTGAGAWHGVLRSSGGVTNQATLTVATGDLETDLINNATLVINPSLDFTATPSTLTNNGSIILDTDTALSNNSNILDGSQAANLLLNQGTIAKSGAELSVIQSPGNHAGGIISASDGTLRFRNDWQFSGGSMIVADNGQIELTGNGDHVINGTSGISGQGSLLVNMASFGSLTVTEPFTVDLAGSGDQGLLLQGFGINLEDTLTNRQGGRWSGGRINGTGAGRLVNEAPSADPFRIVVGNSKILNGNMDSTGWIEQSSTVRVDDPQRLMIASGGGLRILNTEFSITDWNGDGEVVNAGEIEVQSGAKSRIPARFSQVDGGQLVTEGEMDLRGGGMWSGNTTTVVKEAGALELNNARFEFGPGTHSFSEEDSTALLPLDISSAELITMAADAVVIFDVDAVSMLNSSAIGGIGQFENRNRFNWINGTFGVSGMIEFTNAAEGHLRISGSGNLLDGRLDNQGNVIGDITLASDAVVNNTSTWSLFEGENIGTTNPDLPGRFNNFGELSVLSNSFNSSKIDAHLNNIGSIIIDANTTLTINGPIEQLQNGELSGGRWVVKPGAMLVLTEPFDSIGPGTTIHGLQGIQGIEILTHILAGEAVVTGDLIVNGALALSTGGRIIIDGQSSVEVPDGLQNGTPGQQPSIVEMLEEAIVINNPPESPVARGSEQTPILATPLLDNHAVIAPGGLGIPGPFNLDGDLVMHPGSTLAIDIAGPDPIDGHDLLTVSGNAQLGGTIQITVTEDFTPIIGQQFVIATAATTTGSFAEIFQLNREDIIWSLTETATEVILSVDDIAIFADRFE